MGAPIKASEPHLHSNQNETGLRLSRLISGIVFYIIIILIDLILVNLILPYYSKELPILDSKIFEVLIQVIATVLGFAIVALFYFLGKLEDLKIRFVDSVLAAKRTLESTITDQQKTLKTIMEDLEKEIIPEGLEVFESESGLIRVNIVMIVISFGLGILSCFIALFLTTEPFKQYWNITIWGSLIGGISATVSTSYLFNDIWKYQQDLSNRLFRLTMRFDIITKK